MLSGGVLDTKKEGAEVGWGGGWAGAAIQMEKQNLIEVLQLLATHPESSALFIICTY